MNPLPQTEEALFEAARHLRGRARRSAFLDVSCSENPALRKRLERLLEAETQAEQFFNETAAHISAEEAFHSGDPDARTEIPLGTVIGRYKLVQKIGEGGCGAVYLAEQREPVRRRVALKIIRSGMETKSIIAGFEAERQALAMMDHPNIARVFDAGATENGLPYFVMEHVRGTRITEYCDAHRMDLKQRLGLFIQTCNAIQHAHQNCIVHGDIKPSNILIAQHDGVPVPKVIDFGVARATGARSKSREFKLSNPAFGTPAYMSPEQMELGGLEIDTRSDVYSLGVLLFELLAGRTPYPGEALLKAGPAAMHGALERMPLIRPSQAVQALGEEDLRSVARHRQCRHGRYPSSLQGDLDSIVLKALEKDRRHRYETANALAMDVRRHLGDEPVLAREAGWFYSFHKLYRRNRAVFLASGAVALAMIIGLGLSTWLFLMERDARQRAVFAEQQQARLRHEAELRERVTQAALMVSQDRFEEAEAILSEVVLNEPTMEGAAVFRAVGEWHAVNGRWKQAADRFGMLLRINHLEGADVSSLDYLEHGPVLVELGDLERYNQFRHEAVQRFVRTPTPFADRIVKISLLTPAEAAFLEEMLPLVDLNIRALDAAEAAGDDFQAAWRTMPIALYEYRRGNYTAAASWAKRSLGYDDSNAPRIATVRLVLAMAYYRQGRIDEAFAESIAGREVVMEKFRNNVDRGTPVYGFWFDWAFARIIMREATSLIQTPPASIATATLETDGLE